MRNDKSYRLIHLSQLGPRNFGPNCTGQRRCSHGGLEIAPPLRSRVGFRKDRPAYYKPAIDRVGKDAEVIAALQAIVVEEQRWGFWKCHDRLRAQGYGWNHERTWRVYCQLRLNCRDARSGACHSANVNR